jgi:hypothetical protein
MKLEPRRKQAPLLHRTTTGGGETVRGGAKITIMLDFDLAAFQKAEASC